MALPAFYDELLKRTGYADMLENKGTEECKTKLENIRELKSSIVSYVQNSEQPSLAGFLEEVALYTDLEEFNDSDDAVVMLTMHAAKGLEFPNVFLVGFEDGLFPGVRAIGAYEEMEEERRLCYVAITRAMRKLYITSAQQRMLFGRTSANRISRFVDEIPEEHIEKGYVPRGWGYSDKPRGFEDVPQKRSFAPAVKPIISAAAPASAPDFHQGDMVEHKSFGKGMIVTMTPMGGDHLVEIAFDGVGTKRLMLKAASRLMKKL